ncbi:MAG: CD225/dispanin family protein [Muribaculaceae bacterium]|nr:CD225/dispanin family protein [Muribaculaceae bacterium]
MKIWIYINGQQEGPYSLEELLDKPVDENTKVWFEGLPKWYPAGCLDEMKPLFDGSLVAKAKDAQSTPSEEPERSAEEQEAVVEERVEEEVVAEEPLARYAPGRRYTPAARPDKPCPPTYLGWTIFLTVCCCSPVSLASLVASICVTSYYNNGRMDRARKASEVAAWLVMAAIALGFLPVMLMSLFYGN